MFNEARIPFSLDDLPQGESIALHDVDGFIPYLTEKWPEGGRPHRVEISGPGSPKGVDGWVVFRLPPPEQEATGEVIDWDAVRAERINDRPRRQPTEPGE